MSCKAGPSTLLRHLSLRAMNLNKVDEPVEPHRTQSRKPLSTSPRELVLLLETRDCFATLANVKTKKGLNK